MQRDQERDESVDRLLRQTLAGRTHEPTGPCPDGETVATWMEHALPAADAAALETHIADCSRCQALLATIVRTAPAPDAARSLWQRWRLPWLVPIGAAATAVALWVAVPSNQPPTPVTFDARQELPAVPQQQPPAAPLQEPLRDTPATAQPRAETPDVGTRSEAAKTAPPVGRLEAQEAASTFASAEQEGNANRAQDARSADTAATVGAAAESARADVAPAAPAPAAVNAPTEQRRAVVLGQAVSLPEIVSPNPANRWRIRADGRVERSTTAGSAWDTATVEPPAVLVAGSSPSPLVCWLVGRGGAAYVTTDGTRFMRVPFPEAVDLVTVSATDSRSAAVTSSDGRSWRTTDLGRSWTGPAR